MDHEEIATHRMSVCGVCMYERTGGTLRRLRPEPPRIVGTPTSELALKGRSP